MDDLINMMVSDKSPSEISDKIKEILMQKAAQNIETVRPVVAQSMFNQNDSEESESETEEESGSEEQPEQDSEETED
jgi:hypothetical protein